jgi:hypothetical protein
MEKVAALQGPFADKARQTHSSKHNAIAKGDQAYRHINGDGSGVRNG